MIEAFLLLVAVAAIVVFGLIIYGLIRIKFSLYTDPFCNDDYLPIDWDFDEHKLKEEER